ncbi:MAG: zinc ribbon domain-containing protein [Chloroflexi bacterium]|nr:zinc ribbon domain-containing protein [Chloroflexota bacterium]
MPIYEYKCADCKRLVSIFFPSFQAAERRIAAGEATCPRCGSLKLTRQMSRVTMLRAGDASINDLSDDPDSLMEGLNEDDPRSVARWARRMKDNMGEEMDMGPEFDQALTRIEKGEDPDKVMGDIDMDAIGGMAGGGDEVGDFGDDDFGPASIGLG